MGAPPVIRRDVMEGGGRRLPLPQQRVAQAPMQSPETYTFDPDGSFPNSRFAVLVYRSALPADTETMTQAFAANGWSNAWVNGIFTYHHFHSIAHEVLGIASGAVEVMLGGASGRTVRLAAGDVVVIPAGVAHRNVGQPGRIIVVGAYPGGAEYDVKRGAPGEFAEAARIAAAVVADVTDPVVGGAGALAGAWAAARPDVSS